MAVVKKEDKSISHIWIRFPFVRTSLPRHRLSQWSEFLEYLAFGFTSWLPIIIQVSLLSNVSWSEWNHQARAIPPLEIRILQVIPFELLFVSKAVEVASKAKSVRLSSVIGFTAIALIFANSFVQIPSKSPHVMATFELGYWYVLLATSCLVTLKMVNHFFRAAPQWTAPEWLQRVGRCWPAIRNFGVCTVLIIALPAPVTFGFGGKTAFWAGLRVLPLALLLLTGEFVIGIPHLSVVGVSYGIVGGILFGTVVPIVEPLFISGLAGKSALPFAIGFSAGLLASITVGLTAALTFGVYSGRFDTKFLDRLRLALASGLFFAFVLASSGRLPFAIAFGCGTFFGLIVGFAMGDKLSPSLFVFRAIAPFVQLMWVPLLGFLLGYLALVIVSAGAFASLYRLDQRAFEWGSVTAPTWADFVYFAMLNAMTLGYSDLRPANGVAKTLVVSESLLSSIWLLAVFAAIMAYLQPLFDSRHKTNINREESDPSLGAPPPHSGQKSGRPDVRGMTSG